MKHRVITSKAWRSTVGSRSRRKVIRYNLMKNFVTKRTEVDQSLESQRMTPEMLQGRRPTQIQRWIIRISHRRFKWTNLNIQKQTKKQIRSRYSICQIWEEIRRISDKKASRKNLKMQKQIRHRERLSWLQIWTRRWCYSKHWRRLLIEMMSSNRRSENLSKD